MTKEEDDIQGKLIPLQATAGRGLMLWPREIAMALYDFKACKKPSSWTTYEVALRTFFEFLVATKLGSPKEVTRTHLTSYIEYLRTQRKADRTIVNYCAAASSFFEFLARPFDTKGTALIQTNPWKGMRGALPVVNAYQKASNLREFTMPEYLKMIATCDQRTVIGKRDYAIMTLTLWTVRRRQEIGRLLFEDFIDEDGKTYTRFIQKGGKQIKIELTIPVVTSVRQYWAASGRVMKHRSPAWIATTDAGKYLNRARNLIVKEGEQPLSASALDAMIKSRGDQAGLDPLVVNIHMHGLRHLGARMLRAMKVDLKEIKERLGHADLKTTDIYLGSMDTIGSEGLDEFEKMVMGG